MLFGIMSDKLVVLSLALILLTVSWSDSCILLLNGWEPMSVVDRAQLADVVFSGRAVKAYKKQKDPDSNTYTATFRIQDVLKGHKVMANVAGTSNGLEDYYNVSNFGDRSMCYADVEEGQRYIVFATEFNHRLSAKYDDLFGAVDEYSEQKQQEIWDTLGWQTWSGWGACSVSCDGGNQTRSRDCSTASPPCSGVETERRRCNMFHCKAVADILSMIKPHSLPQGVTKDKSRPSAYYITPHINIHAPLKNLFPDHFPEEFSIMAVLKFSGNVKPGFLFTISDLLGFVLLGLRVGLSQSTLVYNVNYSNSKDSFYDLNLDLSRTQWNHVAFSIFKNGTAKAYVECRIADSIELKHTDSSRTNQYSHGIGLDTVISLGRTFHQNSDFPPFQGSVDQLLISRDPLASRLQCEDHVTENSGKPTPDDVIHTDPWQPSDDVIEPLEPTLSAETIELSWSDWSPCSVTCGKGSKTRTASCPENIVEKCYDLVKGAVQKTDCHVGKCKARCRRRCRNGGRCVGNNKCSCLPGYFGRSCQKVKCVPRCEHGGRCVMPNKCSCPAGWGGSYCHQAECRPACANGGHCVQPGFCSCPYGYLPPDCRAYCSSICYNGGSCIGFNMCKCPTGYTGQLCQTAVCESGCGSGGRCVAPNKCLCTAGWRGDDCQTPVCEPGCANGGSCVMPYFCMCPPGTYGTLCEHYMCNPSCMNGGSCVGPNQCRCRPGYSGDFCQQEVCPSPCFNGGTCVRGNCQCRHGYYGDECQHRICQYKAHRIPSYRQHSVPFYYIQNYPCGTWGNDVCSSTRMSYRTVYHIEHRIVYRCT